MEPASVDNHFKGADLEDLLEGLSVEEMIKEALNSLNAVRCWDSEKIEDDGDDLLGQWLLENGVSEIPVVSQWPAGVLADLVDKSELDYLILTLLDKEFEVIRRLIVGWNPADEALLPENLESYINKARRLELDIYRQSQKVLQSSSRASEWIGLETI